MLKITNLTKSFKKIPVVKDISFNIKPGEVCVLAGPNGAGKSTTIKSIAGLLRYDGEILINGEFNKSPKGKKYFSYVPELPGLYPLLTIREHIHFIARAYGIKDYEDYANYLFDLFDLEDKLDKLGSELSKGMQQKVSLCTALITNPKLILLDEPMIGLDPKAIKELKNLILKLKDSGTTILISTHLLSSVEELWDRVLLMKLGEIVLDKTKNELEEELMESGESLEDIFFKYTESKKENISIEGDI
ncbi:ABC transporter ATP-binding protein [Clostridium sardiniense]|uniref:ABC transporter ATP-binding protein n=1 Tax=Clostridium sardiniense TaxID=29369 RepID=UPI003D34839B